MNSFGFNNNLKLNKMTKKILVFFSFLLIVFSAIADEGYVRGKVIDDETGETLIGVTVAVVGTTMGTTTDFDGNYSLELEQGTYDIRISCVSYQAQTFEEVDVKAGEVKIVNACLSEEVTHLKEVVVKAKAVRNTEAAIQVMQKNSASMLDGIGSIQISRLGDDNAASALKRVTGVSVQDNKYVFVRGLSDRYTKINLNNSDIPALDPEKNTVQMDIFPSNIIDNIIVHKTFTPDLPGESTGGHVNIITKDFPEQLTLQFSVSADYNSKSSFNNEFLTYEGGNTDWLGLDDGTRNVPETAQKYYDKFKSEGYNGISYNPKPPFYNSLLGEISNSFNKTMVPETKNSGLNHSYNFAVGNQTKLFGNALGYNIALGYSHNNKYYNDGVYGIYWESVTPDPWEVFNNVTMGEQNAILSGLINLNYKINNNNKIGIRYIRNQSGKKVALSRSGFFSYDDAYVYDYNLAFLERVFNSYQLHGKHVFPKKGTAGRNILIARWQLSYASMTNDEPDLRFLKYLRSSPESDTTIIKTNGAPRRYYRDMKEDDYHANLDLEFPVKIMDIQDKIKVGGLYSYKDRNLDQTTFFFDTPSGLRFFPTRSINEILEDYMINEDNDKGYFYKASFTDDKIYSYEARQKVIAAYAMIDLALAANLRTIAGARVEYTDMEVHNLISEDPRYYRSGSDISTSILPTINLIYSVTENMNMRLAGSQTIARPKFKEIGVNYYDYKTGLYIYGNQNLVNSRITNVDLRWEWFFKPGEKLALSIFYKHFKDPIERKLADDTDAWEIMYYNMNDANLTGVELEFRKKLDFWNILKYFTLGGNLSYINSVIKIPDDVYEDISQQDPTRSKTRPMVGQAPWIINAYINYFNSNIGMESNLGYNVSGEKLYLITRGSLPYVYEQPFHSLNFNISKHFGEKNSFTVELGIDNILDAEFEAVHHFHKPYDQDLDYLRYGYGRTYKIGFKYNIN